MTGPTIRLLTGNDLVIDAETGVHLPGTRPRALFVILALHAGTPLSRDWLSELMWPDAAPGIARQRLRMTLLNLRRSLGDSLAERLDATPETLCLDIDSDRIDLLHFERRAASADAAVREGALASYGGDLLLRFPPVSPDFDAFLADRRETVRTRTMTLLQEQMRRCRGEADIERFERLHQKSLSVDPLNEESLALAMSFWASLRRRDRIRQVFDAHTRHIETELSVAPSPESVALHDRLMEAATMTWTPPAAPALRDGSGEPTPTPSLRKEPPGRRRLIASRGVGAQVVVMALLTILVAGSLWIKRSARAEGPVFLVRQAETLDGSCDGQTALQAQRAIVLAALDRIDRSTIVIGRLWQAVIPIREGVYEIRQDVTCIGANIRWTISVLDGTSREVRWIGRFEGIDLQPEALASLIRGAIAARK